MDEAGSRVRFRNYQNQTKHEFSTELRDVIRSKDSAVLAQDFDAAIEWRDRERELRQKIQEQADLGAIVMADPIDLQKILGQLRPVLLQFPRRVRALPRL